MANFSEIDDQEVRDLKLATDHPGFKFSKMGQSKSGRDTPEKDVLADQLKYARQSAELSQNQLENRLKVLKVSGISQSQCSDPNNLIRDLEEN